MANEKKISDLSNISGNGGIKDEDVFVVVDTSETSGTDAGAEGKTSAINFGDLKTAVGTQGDKGEPGESGPKGATGAPGDDGASIEGAKGEQGDKGDQGPPGGSGSKGEQGIQGIKGGSGVDGAKGEPGTPGDDGNTIVGDKGEPGVDGSKGEPGAPGADGGVTGVVTAPLIVQPQSGDPKEGGQVMLNVGGNESGTDEPTGTWNIDAYTHDDRGHQFRVFHYDENGEVFIPVAIDAQNPHLASDDGKPQTVIDLSGTTRFAVDPQLHGHGDYILMVGPQVGQWKHGPEADAEVFSGTLAEFESHVDAEDRWEWYSLTLPSGGGDEIAMHYRIGQSVFGDPSDNGSGRLNSLYCPDTVYQVHKQFHTLADAEVYVDKYLPYGCNVEYFITADCELQEGMVSTTGQFRNNTFCPQDKINNLIINGNGKKISHTPTADRQWVVWHRSSGSFEVMNTHFNWREGPAINWILAKSYGPMKLSGAIGFTAANDSFAWGIIRCDHGANLYDMGEVYLDYKKTDTNADGTYVYVNVIEGATMEKWAGNIHLKVEDGKKHGPVYVCQRQSHIRVSHNVEFKKTLGATNTGSVMGGALINCSHYGSHIIFLPGAEETTYKIPGNSLVWSVPSGQQGKRLGGHPSDLDELRGNLQSVQVHELPDAGFDSMEAHFAAMLAAAGEVVETTDSLGNVVGASPKLEDEEVVADDTPRG